MDEFILKKLYKNEQIMEQLNDEESLWIITKSSDKWSLYNHTINKKIATSKDLFSLYEKIPNYK